MKNLHIQRVILIVLFVFSPAFLVAEPGERADYYGFGPMEILKLQWGMQRPIVADMNQDGLNDLVVVNNRKARIELLLQKKDFQPGQVKAVEGDDEDINDIFGKEKTWRFRRESYPLDLAVTSLVVVDMNKDGLDDLILLVHDRIIIYPQDGGHHELF